MAQTIRIAAALAALTLIAAEPAPSGRVRILGSGTFSCGTWTASVGADRWVMESWELGFLSALAMQTGSDILNGLDANAIAAWTDNYCRANPLTPLSDAIEFHLALPLIAKATAFEPPPRPPDYKP